LKARNKRLIIGFASLAVFDLAGFVTMVANPDLTARVIPALAGVQILGFIAIAITFVVSRQEYIPVEKPDGEVEGTGKQWVPWLFGFLALLSFLRVVLALLYIAGEEGHRHSWLSPIAGVVMGCFFLWVAVLARRSGSKRASKQPD
jgi:hypothetical protein